MGLERLLMAKTNSTRVFVRPSLVPSMLSGPSDKRFSKNTNSSKCKLIYANLREFRTFATIGLITIKFLKSLIFLGCIPLTVHFLFEENQLYKKHCPFVSGSVSKFKKIPVSLCLFTAIGRVSAFFL